MTFINYINKLFIILFFVINIEISSQNDTKINFLFYNVENLFDCNDDSLTNDNEFTPQGVKHWNLKKYNQKLVNIYKVIVSAGEWHIPDIIAFCEIENRYVLNDLIYKTPLHKFNYSIVHYESPDLRGIDVALIYRKDKFKILFSSPVEVTDNNKYFRTRDILFTKLLYNNQVTFDIYVNHWPSRRGGKENTEEKRMLASEILVNHIKEQTNNSNIIITGDFNDTPSDKSIQYLMNHFSLYNLSYCDEVNCGTIKYKGIWNIFDQFMVSDYLLNDNHMIFTSEKQYFIIQPDYILEQDLNYSGSKPFRTYNGYKYNGGYSDHLPILLELSINIK